MTKESKVYCLNCTAANYAGDKVCKDCGMPLPLYVDFVKDSAKHYSSSDLSPSMMIERIEALEDKVNDLGLAFEEVLSILQEIPGQLRLESLAFSKLPDTADFFAKEHSSSGKITDDKIAGYLRFLKNRESYDRKVRRIRLSFRGTNPERLEMLLLRSQILVYSNEQKKAFGMMERALRLDPDNIELLYFIGEQYFLLRDYQKAFSIWQGILDARPDHFRSRLFSGITLMILGDHSQAKETLLAAADLLPSSPESYLALGIIELQTNRFDEASILFNKANSLKETAFGHLLMADFYKHSDQRDKALEELERAAAFKPNDTNVLLRQAISLIDLGLIKRAREVFGRISMLQPHNEVLKALASTKSKPEMLALVKNYDEYNDSNMLFDSVSSFILNDIEQ